MVKFEVSLMDGDFHSRDMKTMKRKAKEISKNLKDECLVKARTRVIESDFGDWLLVEFKCPEELIQKSYDICRKAEPYVIEIEYREA